MIDTIYSAIGLKMLLQEADVLRQEKYHELHLATLSTLAAPLFEAGEADSVTAMRKATDDKQRKRE
ncbi:MAG: hypothetical protein U5N27_21355 [Rhizobium sp.]|nr:hypothetical protein [Rhizobium sp.]